MKTSTASGHESAIRSSEFNRVATSPLPRDQQQSRRLHEPEWQISTIDPVTGRDIPGPEGHPSIVDGKLTIYFESIATRAEFRRTPHNHPYRHPLGEPANDIDRGG